jgi:hypothetical protein
MGSTGRVFSPDPGLPEGPAEAIPVEAALTVEVAVALPDEVA